MKLKMKLKKHSINLAIVLVSIISIAAPLYSMSKNHTDAAEKTIPARKRTGSKMQKLDRVHFWNTVIKALKKDGHAVDSREIQHAQRYLQRAQARQQGNTKIAKTARTRKNGMRNGVNNTPEKHTNRQTTQQPL